MKTATRLLAMIATGGVVIGGGAALWQLPEPKTASMASGASAANTANTNSSDAQAVQQLVQEGSQLHAAVEAARLQIAALDAAATGPTPTGGDSAAVAAQAQQLAQAKAALAAISQQLAADEALIARLEGGAPRAVPAPGATTGSTAAHSSRTTTTGVPSIGDDPTTFAPAPIPTPVPTVRTTSPTPRPSRTWTASPTSSPTNGRSDD